MDKLMEPSSTLQWVDRTLVKPNDYNPNKVSKACRSEKNSNPWITTFAYFPVNQFRIFSIGNRGKSRT